MRCTIGVLGGDMRQKMLYKALVSEGYNCLLFGFEEYNTKLDKILSQSDIIVLPLPVSEDGINLFAPFWAQKAPLFDIFRQLSADKLVLGGRVSDQVKKLAGRFDINICDYFLREEMTVKNIVPTVEGALAIAISETDFTLHKSNCLVLGYGRLGRVLSEKLSCLGANVTVMARSQKDLAWCSVCGYTGVKPSGLREVLREQNIIFNTVPALILNSELLQYVGRDTLIIDLASAPGGVDYARAKKLQIKALTALSLPGKTAPKSAAEIIKDTILNIAREEKRLD